MPRACCYRAMTCVGVCLLVRGGVSVLLTAGASSRHRFVAPPVRELVTSLLKYHRRTVVRAGPGCRRQRQGEYSLLLPCGVCPTGTWSRCGCGGGCLRHSRMCSILWLSRDGSSNDCFSSTVSSRTRASESGSGETWMRHIVDVANVRASTQVPPLRGEVVHHDVEMSYFRATRTTRTGVPS